MFFFETSIVFNGETVDLFLTYYLLKLGIRERCSVVNTVLEAGDTTPQRLKMNKLKLQRSKPYFCWQLPLMYT